MPLLSATDPAGPGAATSLGRALCAHAYADSLEEALLGQEYELRLSEAVAN